MLTIKKWEEYTYYLFLYLKNGDNQRFRSDFFKLHTNNQIDFFNMLNEPNRQLFYHLVRPEEFAPIFSKLEASEQKLIIEELEEKYALKTIEFLPTDEVVDFLSELPKEMSDYYLECMDVRESERIIVHLKYKQGTAGAIMTTEYVTVNPDETVGEVFRRLKIQGKDAETIYYVYVVEGDNRLVGVISLRELVVNDTDITMQSVMKDQIISVRTYTQQEVVIKIIKDYDLLALPVVTLENQLLGIITIDDIIDAYNEETDEDFGKMAAISGAIDLNVSAHSVIKIRLRPLIFLFVLGLIPAVIILSKPKFLEQIALTAIFIPLITGMAGNTGTQSLAVILRGLSKGKINKESFVKLLKRELLTAASVAVICGAVSAIIGYALAEKNILMGMIVGSSTAISLFICTMAGLFIPYAAYKMKMNLAIISGPFIAAISDIIAVIIYIAFICILL
ncbi:magnesium transporter [Siminovitchia terrae]|uniref:magnesium transporter n=1 Tax=Siminovitchia terrae TaxID=1914933 RepID=UPI0028AC31AF|nr:magnesium transporter [Siminovitchia terrae]